jgi:WXXGXW repeat (2 copies)
MRTFELTTLMALLLGACAWSALPSPSYAADPVDCPVVGINAEEPPPPLPEYEQPPIPSPGYMWTPGYWAWNNVEYYWVPGTWIEPPEPGLLWTPGYWGYRNGVYVFNAGYWGPHVGFYGGVSYGFGYTGIGFQGGYWNNGAFFYNQSVTNLGTVNVTNVYNKTVVENTNVSRVSFNGGANGITARPTPEELAAAKDPRTAATRLQTENARAASKNSAFFASTNNGKPIVAATAHPGDFKGPGIAPAKAAVPVANMPNETLAPNAEEHKAPNVEHQKTLPHPERNEARTPATTDVKTPAQLRTPPATQVKTPAANDPKIPPATQVKTPAANDPKIPPATQVKTPATTEAKRTPAAAEKKELRPLVEKPEAKKPDPAQKPQLGQNKPPPKTSAPPKKPEGKPQDNKHKPDEKQ